MAITLTSLSLVLVVAVSMAGGAIIGIMLEAMARDRYMKQIDSTGDDDPYDRGGD